MTTYNDILSHHDKIFNPLTPKRDWHLISLYHITPESNTKVRRRKELITCKISSDCYTNSPCQNFGKCLENSIENMHTDVRM